jgi:hypothetical protein
MQLLSIMIVLVSLPAAFLFYFYSVTRSNPKSPIYAQIFMHVRERVYN